MREIVTSHLVALALCAAVGCGSPDDPTPAAAPAPVPVPPAPIAANPAAPSNLRLVAIETGRSVNQDKTMHDASSLFIPTDEVWASVVVEGQASAATVGARWVGSDGALLAQQSEQVTPSGSAAVAFHLEREGGWALGQYRIEIVLNGVAVGGRSFEVREPPL